MPINLGGSSVAESEVVWTSVDDEKHKLDAFSLKPIVRENGYGYDNGEQEETDYQLALTGDVFRWMLDFAPIRMN